MVQAAVASDSSTTAFHAVRTVGAVSEGSAVGIIGLGGLGGLSGARFAALAGAKVYGVDVDPNYLRRCAWRFWGPPAAGPTAALADRHPGLVQDSGQVPVIVV